MFLQSAMSPACDDGVWRRSDVSWVERHVTAGHIRTPAELLTSGARPHHQIQRQTLHLCIRGAGRLHHWLPEDDNRETWAAQRDSQTSSQKQRRYILTSNTNESCFKVHSRLWITCCQSPQTAVRNCI